MNAAKLIAREVADLPEPLCSEVLDFIGFLKTRHPAEVGKTAAEARLADLTLHDTCVAPGCPPSSHVRLVRIDHLPA
jgi:hypothetical protein